MEGLLLWMVTPPKGGRQPKHNEKGDTGQNLTSNAALGYSPLRLHLSFVTDVAADRLARHASTSQANINMPAWSFRAWSPLDQGAFHVHVCRPEDLQRPISSIFGVESLIDMCEEISARVNS